MIRFLADASLHDAIVTGCRRREPAIDFLSAHEARLEAVSDPVVLAFATLQNRILVTSDLRTMPRHFGHFLEFNGACAGVFLVRQRASLAEVIEARLCWYGPLRTPTNGRIGSSRFRKRNQERALAVAVRILAGVSKFGSPS
jgi:hypothetical protein